MSADEPTYEASKAISKADCLKFLKNESMKTGVPSDCITVHLLIHLFVAGCGGRFDFTCFVATGHLHSFLNIRHRVTVDLL